MEIDGFAFYHPYHCGCHHMHLLHGAARVASPHMDSGPAKSSSVLHEVDAVGDSRIRLIFLALSLRQLPTTGLGLMSHPVCIWCADSRAEWRNSFIQPRSSHESKAMALHTPRNCIAGELCIESICCDRHRLGGRPSNLFSVAGPSTYCLYGGQ